MLRRITLLTLLLIAGVCSSKAQDKFLKPDFTSIENTIKDRNSAFYYPNLFKRYMNDDTTLSDKEYWMLYYGYFFHEDASPLGDLGANNDSIKAIRMKATLNDNDWNRLIFFAKKSLKTAPFDLERLNMIYVAYKKLGNAQMVNVYLHKLGGIVRAIVSSGDGRTDKSGYFVLQVSDEYAIISILGYEFGGSQSLTASHCDYLTLAPNKEDLKGLYFDVTQIFKGYEKMFMKK